MNTALPLTHYSGYQKKPSPDEILIGWKDEDAFSHGKGPSVSLNFFCINTHISKEKITLFLTSFLQAEVFFKEILSV
jgi:hypothetical protein